MKLKELRKERNLSQADVSKYLGISQNTYSTYETGRAEPSMDNLCKLATLFDSPLDCLLERKREEDLLDFTKLSQSKRAFIHRVMEMPDKMIEALNSFLNEMKNI